MLDHCTRLTTYTQSIDEVLEDKCGALYQPNDWLHRCTAVHKVTARTKDHNLEHSPASLCECVIGCVKGILETQLNVRTTGAWVNIHRLSSVPARG
jgi:hypothetical protein